MDLPVETSVHHHRSTMSHVFMYNFYDLLQGRTTQRAAVFSCTTELKMLAEIAQRGKKTEILFICSQTCFKTKNFKTQLNETTIVCAQSEITSV